MPPAFSGPPGGALTAGRLREARRDSSLAFSLFEQKIEEFEATLTKISTAVERNCETRHAPRAKLSSPDCTCSTVKKIFHGRKGEHHSNSATGRMLGEHSSSGGGAERRLKNAATAPGLLGGGTIAGTRSSRSGLSKGDFYPTSVDDPDGGTKTGDCPPKTVGAVVLPPGTTTKTTTDALTSTIKPPSGKSLSLIAPEEVHSHSTGAPSSNTQAQGGGRAIRHQSRGPPNSGGNPTDSIVFPTEFGMHDRDFAEIVKACRASLQSPWERLLDPCWCGPLLKQHRPRSRKSEQAYREKFSLQLELGIARAAAQSEKMSSLKNLVQQGSQKRFEICVSCAECEKAFYSPVKPNRRGSRASNGGSTSATSLGGGGYSSSSSGREGDGPPATGGNKEMAGGVATVGPVAGGSGGSGGSGDTGSWAGDGMA